MPMTLLFLIEDSRPCNRPTLWMTLNCDLEMPRIIGGFTKAEGRGIDYTQQTMMAAEQMERFLKSMTEPMMSHFLVILP